MCFIVEGRRVSSHTRPTPGGTSATGSARRPVMGRAARAVLDGLPFARRRPARPPAHRRRRGPVTRRRRLTRIGPARPHPVTQGGSRTRDLRPGTPSAPRPAAIPDSGAKSAPLTGCPRGFSQVAGNDHPSGAHFSGCQGVPALSRGDPGPWPRRARGGLGAGAGSAACDYEAYWGAYHAYKPRRRGYPDTPASLGCRS